MKNIEGMINDFLSDYRKISSKEKYKLMLRLLYCITLLKSSQLV